MKSDILFAGGQQKLPSLFLYEGVNLLCDKCCEDIWSIFSIGYTEVLQLYVSAFSKTGTVSETSFYRYVSLFITFLMWLSESMEVL